MNSIPILTYLVPKHSPANNFLNLFLKVQFKANFITGSYYYEDKYAGMWSNKYVLFFSLLIFKYVILLQYS
jgi:hypothetical protein